MNQNKWLPALFVAILLFLPSSSQALKIVSLGDVGGTFYPGDSVDLGTVLINNESIDANLKIEQYLAYPGAEPMPLYEEAVIGPGNNTMVSDFSFDVSGNAEAGTYTHSVRVYETSSSKLSAEKTTTF